MTRFTARTVAGMAALLAMALSGAGCSSAADDPEQTDEASAAVGGDVAHLFGHTWLGGHVENDGRVHERCDWDPALPATITYPDGTVGPPQAGDQYKAVRLMEGKTTPRGTHEGDFVAVSASHTCGIQKYDSAGPNGSKPNGYVIIPDAKNPARGVLKLHYTAEPKQRVVYGKTGHFTEQYEYALVGSELTLHGIEVDDDESPGDYFYLDGKTVMHVFRHRDGSDVERLLLGRTTNPSRSDPNPTCSRPASRRRRRPRPKPP